MAGVQATGLAPMTSLWEDPQSHFPENLMADLKHPIWGFTENLGVIASLIELA
jgi:hypothetical protein